MSKENVTAISVAIQTGTPIITWGSPGVGKTKTAEAIGRSLRVHMQTVIAAIREPSDFGGLPIVNQDDKGVWMAPPGWAIKLNQEAKDFLEKEKEGVRTDRTKKKLKALTAEEEDELFLDTVAGILFLDEASTAPPAVQSAMLRLVLDRVIGDFTLDSHVAIMAAANPAEVAAGGWELSPPLANRFIHLDWNLSTEEWCSGMVSGWPDPEIPRLHKGWRDNITQTRSLVSSFVHRRPELLCQIPDEESGAGRAWPSPRTWDMSATMMAASFGFPAEIGDLLVTGCVGQGAATELAEWKNNLDLPDPEEVLKNPKGFSLPDRPDKAYALLSSVVAATLSNLNKKRWAAAWDVLALTIEAGMPDVGAGAARMLAEHHTEIDAPVPAGAQAFGPLLVEVGLL